MISHLRGKLIFKKNNEIIIDVGGVGYQIFISKKVSEKFSELNSEYSLTTFLDVKENSLQLYGFIDEREREIFKLLLSVSGIGPKIAHGILTHLSFEEIITIISDNSFASRVKIPGLGSKKIELISMTLRDKIYKIEKSGDNTRAEIHSSESSESKRFDSLNALMNLGYQRNEAERIIREVLKQTGSSELSTEEIIRKSLEYISK